MPLKFSRGGSSSAPKPAGRFNPNISRGIYHPPAVGSKFVAFQPTGPAIVPQPAAPVNPDTGVAQTPTMPQPGSGGGGSAGQYSDAASQTPEQDDQQAAQQQQNAQQDSQQQAQDDAQYQAQMAQYQAQLEAYNAAQASQTITPVVTAQKEGLLTRFWHWLFGKPKSQMSGDPIQDAVAGLVIRARSGDQNAMGMIAEVRKSAMAGNPKAQYAYKCLEDYIRRNPANISRNKNVQVGDESIRNQVALANGPLLTNDYVAQFCNTFGSEDEKKAFKHGVKRYKHMRHLKQLKNTLPKPQQRALQIGVDFGVARSIQAVRIPGNSIRDFSPVVAFELGE